jgi:two-component system, LuxR family, sensor kinase FixL
MLQPPERERESQPGLSDRLSASFSTSSLLPVIAVAFAIGIFVIDTVTPLEAAVAVLYVVVIMLASGFLPRRGVLLTSATCLVLTALSFLLTHELDDGTGLVRCLMSIAAIGITTFLTLKNQSANMTLREQARLLDLTHDAIFARDTNDVITYWNRGAMELYGWRQDEATGRNAHQILHTIFPVPFDSIMQEALRSGRWEGELVHTRRDGTQVTVSSRWSLQRDERMRPVAVLETNTDISAHIKAQEALQESQAQLAHATRVTTLGELTASIAHEVNQPLAAIAANAGACLRWLDRDPPRVDEVRHSVDSIIADSVRANEVIQRLRSLAHKGGFQRVRLNLNDVVNEALLLVQRELLTQRVSLRLELDAGLPAILGDPIQLQQVVINLAVNGVQAMSTVFDRPRVLHVRTFQSDQGSAQLEVHDSGIGIDPKDVLLLFNAFYTTKPDGMGMGLSISRSIVEAHGGAISSAGAPGQGTVFKVTIPIA